MQKNIKIIILIVFLLLFIAVLSFFLNIKINNVKKISYQKGWDDAKVRLYGQMGPIVTSNIITNMVFGTIVDIKDNKINVKINSTELLSNPELDNRVVIINNQTKIYKFQKKDNEKYKKELDNYYKENNIDPNTFIPGPDGQLGIDKYEEILVNLDSLKTSQLIDVYADKNIRELKEFIAKKIIIKK